MQTFLSILLAIVVLLVMITVHEFGHYCAGKIFGFKINEFSIGFGPALYKKTKKDGEVFSVRALPLGGYCAFEGEDEDGKDEDGKPNPDAFNNRPAWKRLIVLLSGVTFNFLFGILTAAIYLMVTGYSVPKISASVNSAEVTGSGLQSNDVVIAVNGKTIEAYRSFNDLVADFEKGETFTVTVNRDGEVIDVKASKQEYNSFYYVYDISKFANKLFVKDENDQIVALDSTTFLASVMSLTEASDPDTALKDYLATIYKDANGTETYENDVQTLVDDGYFIKVSAGVSMGITYTYVAESYGFFESLLKAWPFCFYLCGLILSSLGGLFTGATALKDMGGTVTAVSQIAEISQMGISYFLLLLPLLAMNLAVFNILPIPSLDGARAVFVLIEMIFRKPVNRKVEGWIHTIGLFLLLGLVVFFDIYHFAVAARLLI